MVTRRTAQPTQGNGLPLHVLERVEEHSGFKKGDRCYIDGDREGRYTFQHADVYENGTVAAIIYGGPPGHGKWYTPGIDRLLPASGPSKASSQAGTENQLEPQLGDIAGRRKALKWSRGDLSLRCGVGVPAIASLENGKSPRDKDARGKVMAALVAGEQEQGIVSALVPTGPVHIDLSPTLMDQVIAEKFGGMSPDELEALGLVDEDEDDVD